MWEKGRKITILDVVIYILLAVVFLVITYMFFDVNPYVLLALGFFFVLAFLANAALTEYTDKYYPREYYTDTCPLWHIILAFVVICFVITSIFVGAGCYQSGILWVLFFLLLLFGSVAWVHIFHRRRRLE
jgi:hypothetical protein